MSARPTHPPDLPPALADRARSHLAGHGDPPPPARPSATVILLRDTDAGLETYLLRRVAGMAFAAGMHVFPGGVVDPRDADPSVPWVGPGPGVWAALLSADEGLTRALVCAAVRETFEEAAVLLAGPAPGPAAGVTPAVGPGVDVVRDVTGEDWEADRQALIGRRLTFSELLERRGLVLHADLVGPWAHWITPEFEQRRYDTRFFVAAMPTHQRTRDVGGEADRVIWVSPAAGLRAHERGELAMLPPTVATLTELAAHRTVAEVLAAARRREIRPLLPRAVLEAGEVVLRLPGEPGYPPARPGS